MENEDLTERQIIPTTTQSEDGSQSRGQSAPNLNEADDDEAIPTEVAEALHELPPEQRRIVSSYVS
jgi:hypothetical protein